MGCLLSFSKPEFWFCHCFNLDATYSNILLLMEQPALTRNLSNDVSKPKNTSERAQQKETHEEGTHLATQNWCHPCSALEGSVVTMIVLSWIKVSLSLRPGKVFEIISNLFQTTVLLKQARLFCFLLSAFRHFFFLSRWALTTAV